MNTLAAAGILVDVTSTALQLMQNAQQISQLIQRAQTENRDTFTADEWAVITGADDAARKALAAAISKALAVAR